MAAAPGRPHPATPHPAPDTPRPSHRTPPIPHPARPRHASPPHPAHTAPRPATPCLAAAPAHTAPRPATPRRTPPGPAAPRPAAPTLQADSASGAAAPLSPQADLVSAGAASAPQRYPERGESCSTRARSAPQLHNIRPRRRAPTDDRSPASETAHAAIHSSARHSAPPTAALPSGLASPITPAADLVAGRRAPHHSATTSHRTPRAR